MMRSQLSLLLILLLGVLLTACAPSDTPIAAGSGQEPSSGNSGAAAVARCEPRTASPVSSQPVAGSERTEGAGREPVAQGVSKDDRPVVAAEGPQLGYADRSGIAVQVAASATSSRARTDVGGSPMEARLPLGGSSGGKATPGGVAAVGAPAVATARVQAPPLPLAVVAAAHPQAFTPEQMRALVQLGESFLTETTPASPNAVSAVAGSPELTPAERWAASAEASDERFKAMFGYQAFNAMQLQRAREAYAEAKAK